MRKFLGLFGVKPPKDLFFDYVTSVLDDIDTDAMRRVGDNVYAIGNDMHVFVKYLTPDCFDEIEVQVDYLPGRGMNVVIRNYAEHLVVLSHAMRGDCIIMKFPVPTESFALGAYRKKMDAFGERVMTAINRLDSSPLPECNSSSGPLPFLRLVGRRVHIYD